MSGSLPCSYIVIVKLINCMKTLFTIALPALAQEALQLANPSFEYVPRHNKAPAGILNAKTLDL